MNYQEVLDGENNKHIIIDNGDGSFKSFPVDESNPEYLSFVEALEKEAK
jgi:hypothetical protein